MKKLIVSLLTLVLCLSLSFLAFAEVDLTSKSVNELNELRVQIESEILNKGGDVRIETGTFIGGADIAPGSYEFKMIEEDFLTTYILYPADGSSFIANYIESDAYTRITINEGDKLELSDPCYIRKAGKIGF